MKVKKILQKFYRACVEHNTEEEKRLWLKLLKKSLKGKNTDPIK